VGGECVSLEGVVREVAKVGDLLIELMKECARDETVYTLDEMYDVAIEKLVERANSIGDVETVVRVAVILGMCRGVYLGKRYVSELECSLTKFYLYELVERFKGEEVRKDETESEEAGV